MRLKHLVVGIVGVTGVILVNARFQVFPQKFLYGVLGLLVVAGLVSSGVLKREQKTQSSDGPVQAVDALDRVNEYLREKPGAFPIDTSQKQRLHEETLTVDKNGTEYETYAVIGREATRYAEDGTKVTQTRADAETIRVIWNLTEDDLERFDGEVPGRHRDDPYYGKEEWLRREGYKVKEKPVDRRRSGNTVIVGGQQQRRQSQEGSDGGPE